MINRIDLKKKAKTNKSNLEQKEEYFKKNQSLRKRKKWYKKNIKLTRVRKKKLKREKKVRILKKIPLPKRLSFVRWIIIDILRRKNRKFWGVYSFVALPGQGKTMSMVAHMERCRQEYGKRLYIISNFHYKYNDLYVNDWMEMIDGLLYAHRNNKLCLIALDEVHLWWDANEYRTFPKAVKGMLSLNRKYNLEFLCTSQIFDNIPKPIRDLSNYVVLCKNRLNCDRLFISYYYQKTNYESKFDGKLKNADMIRDFIADDRFYSLYDTKETIKVMINKENEERSKKEAAFNILFGNNYENQGQN